MNFKNERINIMVDIETLGNEITNTVFQIAAVPFNIVTGEMFLDNKFNMLVDISKEKADIKGSTLKWWLETDPLLLAKLLSLGVDSEKEVLQYFFDWIENLGDGEVCLWGNGIGFDNVIIRSRMNHYGITYPIKYNKDRDVRTIMELAGDKLNISEKELRDSFKDESLVAHDAIDDVISQIKVVSGCYKIIMS